jgi:hypothetical protein
MINLRILQKLNKIDLLILIDLILMALSLCLINYSNIDLVIQDYFFDFTQKSWIVDKDEMIKKFIFYQFPKILLGLTIITLAVFSFLGFKKKSPFFTKNRHRFFLIFLGLCLIPLIAGNIKKFTNVYCPNQLEYYGGGKPYVKIFDHYPSGFYQEKKGKCFPAGHAVTGFSLLILFFALAKKTHRIYGLCAGLALGFIMGIYQMAKGVHFFGDTLISMLVCFLLAALIARIYECKFLVKNGDLEN